MLDPTQGRHNHLTCEAVPLFKRNGHEGVRTSVSIENAQRVADCPLETVIMRLCRQAVE